MAVGDCCTIVDRGLGDRDSGTGAGSCSLVEGSRFLVVVGGGLAGADGDLVEVSLKLVVGRWSATSGDMLLIVCGLSIKHATETVHIRIRNSVRSNRGWKSWRFIIMDSVDEYRRA